MTTIRMIRTAMIEYVMARCWYILRDSKECQKNLFIRINRLEELVDCDFTCEPSVSR